MFFKARLGSFPWVVVAVFASCSFWSCGSESPQEFADLTLSNGVVWTGAEPATAEAVAVRGNRIVAVGTDEDVMALAGPDTEVRDLEGAFVVPGFNDNHTHFGSAARFLEFNIMRASSQDDLVTSLERVVGVVAKGEWITGGLWGAYDQWALGSAGGSGRTAFTPDLYAVGELAGDHPIFLTKFDGAEYAVNRLALERAGLDPDAELPDGIEAVRDEGGRFSGILRGSSVAAHFQELIPAPSRERRMAMTRNALDAIRRAGVVSISDMSDDLQLELFEELRDAGELTARIHFRYPLDRFSELEERGIEAGGGDPWIRLGSLKGHIDGIMGNSTARFFEPYDHDSSSRGRWRRLMVDENGDFVPGQFLDYMLGADAAGLQMSIHAIGDEANRLLLDYLDELDATNGERDRRFRLVHAQVIADEDYTRLGEHDVIAEVQPYHLSDDMRWMEERIGVARSRGAYAFRKITDGGGVLSFGSDWPGTAASEYPIDPLRGIYAAVSRKTIEGTPAEGWFPDQRVTIEEALRAYTWGSAYANYDEENVGTIEVGKLADLTVVDRDLRTIESAQILEARALATIVDGEFVFDALPGGVDAVDSGDSD